MSDKCRRQIARWYWTVQYMELLNTLMFIHSNKIIYLEWMNVCVYMSVYHCRWTRGCYTTRRSGWGDQRLLNTILTILLLPNPLYLSHPPPPILFINLLAPPLRLCRGPLSPWHVENFSCFYVASALMKVSSRLRTGPSSFAHPIPPHLPG